jgi:hypothetical protein
LNTFKMVDEKRDGQNLLGGRRLRYEDNIKPCRYLKVIVREKFVN